jgi:hypothetical protein
MEGFGWAGSIFDRASYGFNPQSIPVDPSGGLCTLSLNDT